MTYYTTLFIIFACAGYLIATDDSVAKATVLIGKLVKTKIEGLYYRIILNPENPVNRWLIWRRSFKLAEQLRKELNDQKTTNEDSQI